MAHLTECFKVAGSNLEPGDDADNAKAAHEDVREHLEDDDHLISLGIKTRLIGSYAREVSIRRMKDVDVFAMLENAGPELECDEILEHVEGVLEEAFPGDVTRQDHSVQVELSAYDLSVDVVPARPCGDHWEIPDPIDDWVETNPLELGELTTKMNKLHKLGQQGIYVPMVKYIRQIRRARDIDRPSGLYFEVLTYWAFESEEADGNSRASYLASTLAGVVDQLETAIEKGGLKDPTLPDKTVATKATDKQLKAALEKMQQAETLARQALDEDDECESAQQWRVLLGRVVLGDDELGDWVFPIPSDCGEEGKSDVYIPGERVAPRGTDRFA